MNALLVAILFAFVSLTYANSCPYCTNGTRVATGKEAESNGCGTALISKWYSRQVSKGAVDCCNAHDICYTDCTKTRDECDKEFDDCIDRNRKTNSVNFYQRAMENLLAMLVKSRLGCNAYIASQEEYCKCQ